jgi:hypothetical protein
VQEALKIGPIRIIVSRHFRSAWILEHTIRSFTPER